MHPLQQKPVGVIVQRQEALHAVQVLALHLYDSLQEVVDLVHVKGLVHDDAERRDAVSVGFSVGHQMVLLMTVTVTVIVTVVVTVIVTVIMTVIVTVIVTVLVTVLVTVIVTGAGM